MPFSSELLLEGQEDEPQPKGAPQVQVNLTPEEALRRLSVAPPEVGMGLGMLLGPALPSMTGILGLGAGVAGGAAAVSKVGTSVKEKAEEPLSPTEPVENLPRVAARSVNPLVKRFGDWWEETLYSLETVKRFSNALPGWTYDMAAGTLKGEIYHSPEKFEKRIERNRNITREANLRDLRQDIQRFQRTSNPAIKADIVRQIKGRNLPIGLIDILSNGDFRRAYAQLDEEETKAQAGQAMPIATGYDVIWENEWRVPKEAIKLANMIAPGAKALGQVLPTNPIAQELQMFSTAVGAGYEIARQLGKPVEELTWGDVVVHAGDDFIRSTYPQAQALARKLNLPQRFPAQGGDIVLNPRRIVEQAPMTAYIVAGTALATGADIAIDPDFALAATGAARGAARRIMRTGAKKAELAAVKAEFEAAGGMAGAAARAKAAKQGETGIGPPLRKPLTDLKPGEKTYTPEPRPIGPLQETIQLEGEAPPGSQVRRAPPPGPLGEGEQPYPPTPEFHPEQAALEIADKRTGFKFKGARGEPLAPGEEPFVPTPGKPLPPKPGERVAQVPAAKVIRPGFHPQAGFTGQSLGDALGRDLLTKAQTEKLSTEDIRGMMERARSWREGMLEGVAEVDQPDVMRAIGNELESSAAELEGFGRTSAAGALRRSREKLLRDWQEKMNKPVPKPEAPPLRPQGMAEIDLPAQVDPAGELTREALEAPPPRAFFGHGEAILEGGRRQGLELPIDREVLNKLHAQEIRDLEAERLLEDRLMQEINGTKDPARIDELTQQMGESFRRQALITEEGARRAYGKEAIAAQEGRPISGELERGPTPSPLESTGVEEFVREAAKRVKLNRLQQKLMRSGVGEDVLYKQSSLRAAQASSQAGKVYGLSQLDKTSWTRLDVAKLTPEQGTQVRGYGPSIRFVASREAMKERGLLRQPKGPKAAQELEEVLGDVPLEDVLRVEIDPSLLSQVESHAGREFTPTQEELEDLIRGFEDQGVPVFIRPLFHQTSVESYRPYIPPERVPDVVMRGPDSGQRMTQVLRQGALTPPGEGGTSVERLAPALRQTEIRDEDMVGEFGRTLGIDKDKALSPIERGELLTERSLRPGWKEPVKDFLPRGPAFTPPEGGGPPVAGRGGGGAAPSPPSSPGRHTAEAVSGREPQDLWFWGRNFGSPQWVLDDPRDPLSQAIYTSQRHMRTDAGMRAWDYEQNLQQFDKNLSGLGPKAYKESSRRIMRYLQAPEESADLDHAWAGLSLKEKEAAREARTVLIDFLKRWAEKKGVGKDLDLFPTGLKTIQNPLEFAGRILWGKEKFQTVGKNGNIVNVFPRELADMQIGDNPLFTHLPWSQGHQTTDAVGVVDALVRGIIREEVLEPNWKNMRDAADALPRYKREYVTRWIERQQGRPSIWGGGLGERYSTTGARRQKSFFSTAVSEGADFLTMSLYRGFLNGSATYNFDQFFGQTFQNLAAKHGPFAAFEGIAKHYQAAFDGVPKPVLMGAFEALFHDHQASTIGRQMNQVPWIRNFRRFWKDVIEPQTGPLTGEFMARSSAAHIALKQFVDETNLAQGTHYTVRDMLQMAHAGNPLGQEAMYRIAIESERMHGVYGVDGQNPTLGMLIPRRVATLSTMFLHWFPKQGEFLFGPIVKERDPGILVNYMLLTGWLTNVMARSQGIDYERSSWFGAAPQARAGLPLPMGPAAQAIAMYGMAIDEEINGDPEQARRYYVELGGLLDAVVAGALHSPLGAPQLNKTQRFFQMLDQEALYTPGREVAELLEKEYGVPQLGGFPERMLQDRWGPTAPEQPGPIFGPAGANPVLQEELDGSLLNILRSEAIPRALGLRTLSDRQRRRIDQTIRRSNRLLQAEMTPLIERAVEVMREDANFTQNPEWQRVIQEAKDKGLPIEPGLEARVYQLVLPQLLRTFRASNKITRAMTKGMLDDLYPEIFADPIHPLKPSNWPEPSRTLPKGELPKASSPFDPELLQEMQLQP